MGLALSKKGLAMRTRDTYQIIAVSCDFIYTTGQGDVDEEARDRCKIFLRSMATLAETHIASPWLDSLRENGRVSENVTKEITSRKREALFLRGVVTVKLFLPIARSQVIAYQARMNGLFLLYQQSMPSVLRKQIESSFGGDTFRSEFVTRQPLGSGF